MYIIVISPCAKKDVKLIKLSKYYGKYKELLLKISQDPYAPGDNFKVMSGKIPETFSRRISLKHRLVYVVDEDIITIEIVRCWGHY